MIVVDSSTALKWLLPEDGAQEAEAILGQDLVAPDVIFVEVANVLGKKVRAEELSLSQAASALDLLAEIVGRIESTRPLLRHALELSAALSHPVYDCLFLACALSLNASLATHDDQFRRRASAAGYSSQFLDLPV